MVGVQKPKIRWAISLFLVMLYFSGLTAQAQYGGGTGEPNDPYLIYTAEQMNEIGLHDEDWDKHFKLMADIDLSNFDGKEDRPAFNIIAPDTDNMDWRFQGIPFTGFFEGNGHTISNFSYTSTDTNYVGLFGYVNARSAQIKDLGLIDPNIDAGTGDYVGSLVGCLSDGTITGCYVEGGTVKGDYNVGGLVGAYGEEPGYFEPPFTISNCYSTSSVQGTMRVGGLVGSNYEGLITNCYATGSVSGTMNVGGLVGQNGRMSVFYNNPPTPGTIINCYSTGIVSGQSNVGGLVGLYIEGPVFGCFWDIETSGQLTSTGGKGRTTAQMQMADTFIGWDGCGSEGIWTIDDGKDYPRLWWENKPGKLLEGQLSDFLQGAGTEDDPYLIYTAEQINMIGVFPCEWDKYFLLMEDIDLGGYTGTDFNIIGTWWDNAFTGVFDGNGKKISNFRYTSSDTNRIGFFGWVRGENALIKDLELTNAEVDAGTGNLVGSLVGYLGDGTIAGCYVEGGIVSGNDNVGGLVGYNRGSVTDCYSTGEVNGSSDVGGIVGFNFGAVTHCYSMSAVSGSVDVGGLVGLNARSVTLCYSTGTVSGDEIVGGLVGKNGYKSGITYYESYVRNSYSTGAVRGNNRVGGLVGDNQLGTVTASFWDVQTSEQATSADGMGKTTAEMQNPITFMEAGWDFVGQPDGPSDIWAEPSGGGYPILWWQLSSLPALSSFSGGTGEPNNPYLISTTDDLNHIGYNPRLMAEHFKLINDIDLTGVDFFIIGNWQFPFTGVFDGEGKTISNFSYTSTDKDYIGLFAYVSGGAEIKDLGLIAPNIDAGTGHYVGALIGLSAGTITGCYVESGSVSGDKNVGGLVGYNWGGTITNCYATAIVVGHDRVGGLVGFNLSYGYITNCYSAGSVSGDVIVGGLVGDNYGTTTDCYALSSVSGIRLVGGLVGWNYRGTITNCYSTGSVLGTNRVGGLIGSNNDNVYSSFWDIENSGQITSDGGTGKTTAEIQMATTFLNAGWDFVDETANGTEDIWWILEGQDYPRLWWEKVSD